MYDKSILDWMREQISNGYSKEQIENYLLQQGYQKEQIDYMFSKANENYELDPLVYFIGGSLFLLLSFLFGKFTEGLILLVTYIALNLLTAKFLLEKSIIMRISILTSNVAYLVYSFFYSKWFLFPLIIANILSLHYHLRTNKKYSFNKMSTIFLTSFFVTITAVLLFVYLSGVTIFQLFRTIYLWHLLLFSTLLIFLSTILFLHTSIFLLEKVFGRFNFDAFFKFDFKLLKFLNYFSTKDGNTNSPY